MARLEELQAGTRVIGLVPGPAVTVKSASWIGQQAVELVFEDAGGVLHKRLVYREDEHSIDIAQAGRPWSFDADGHLFRLVSEAHRIKLAWLFDPYVAVTASSVEPLPHQISAVCTRRCCRASRCGSSSPTTRARARPSWPACSSRSSSFAATWSGA